MLGHRQITFENLVRSATSKLHGVARLIKRPGLGSAFSKIVGTWEPAATNV